MFVQEAIPLQCFTPTRYVKNGEYPHARAHITLTTFTRFAKNSTSEYACIDYTVHVAGADTRYLERGANRICTWKIFDHAPN